MIADKGNCSHCGQKIQRTTHDKCMYCGAMLNPSQHFTEDEKAIIENRQKHQEEQFKQRHQSSMNSSGGFGGADVCDTDMGCGGD